MKIVLFDMDGTLTPPRQEMDWSMVDALYNLQSSGFEIGILSGSDLQYIRQQCNVLFDLTRVDCSGIHWLPCNGTKYFKYTRLSDERVDFKKIYEHNMRENLGKKKWRRLIQLLVNLQSSMTHVHRKIPLTGTFIDYRGSTVNWCPIGRSAGRPDRDLWELLNKDNSIRKVWLKLAKEGLLNANLDDVVIKYGGDTSFDIYPEGWDKTFAFRNFSDYKEIYFVGDRCTPTGNDYEAFKLAGSNGFETKSPEQTKDIISQLIKKNKE
mgnify:FL=1